MRTSRTSARVTSLLKVGKVLVVLCSHIRGVGIALSIVLGVDVEALGVARVADGGHDGSGVAAVVDIVPIDALEEGVLLDAAGAAADVAQSPGPVDGAERPDDVLRLRRDGRLVGEYDWLFDDSARGDLGSAVRGRAQSVGWLGGGEGKRGATGGTDCLYISMGFWCQKGG